MISKPNIPRLSISIESESVAPEPKPVSPEPEPVAPEPEKVAPEPEPEIKIFSNSFVMFYTDIKILKTFQKTSLIIQQKM